MVNILKRILYFLAILCIAICAPSLAYAEDQYSFGPKNLTINLWHFHLSFHRVTVDDPGEGILNITKNSPDKEIQGGFVIFNREIISLRNFLLGGDTELKKTVSLTSTTRMMVFLQGDSGASITLKVKKKDAVAPVSATFSAEPSNIILGETSTLTWSTTNADNVNIGPSIGGVSLSGTHNVEPAETTKYILNASGLGGTITETATVTVTVPNNPPVANQDTATTVTDTPVDINVLANDTDADGDALIISAFTQPENGVVADTGGGIFNYIPNPGFHGTDSFTYAVIDGNGGTDSSTVSVTVLSLITVDITSPSDGATLSMPYVNVQGIITSTSGAETGVAVNGVIAVVFENQFTANHIPLQEGQNAITVTVTDVNGISVTETLTIYAAVSENFIKLSAYPESGIAPLEVALRVNGSFSIADPVIIPTGPGTVEQLESENPNKYKYRIATEGLYTFTGTVVGPNGNTYADTISINVLPFVQIDTLLRAKWDGLTSALESADIASALGFILPPRRDDYEITFNLLKDQWPSIIATYSGFEVISIEGLNAKYELAAYKDGKTYVYQIDFRKDASGLWFIDEF